MIMETSPFEVNQHIFVVVVTLTTIRCVQRIYGPHRFVMTTINNAIQIEHRTSWTSVCRRTIGVMLMVMLRLMDHTADERWCWSWCLGTATHCVRHRIVRGPSHIRGDHWTLEAGDGVHWWGWCTVLGWNHWVVGGLDNVGWGTFPRLLVGHGWK